MTITIMGCRDPLMWYADHIGEAFEVIRFDQENYWVREPAGYLNIVKREDATEKKS